ncbi:hypothetical protein BLOT_001025 [Blomia tropicalis]|nr:hypothetical protein BLOT_001025 [Blomia tropicalis]
MYTLTQTKCEITLFCGELRQKISQYDINNGRMSHIFYSKQNNSDSLDINYFRCMVANLKTISHWVSLVCVT